MGARRHAPISLRHRDLFQDSTNMNNGHILARARHLAWRAWAASPIGARRWCCLCGQKVQRFLPYRGACSDMPAVLSEMHVIGSDVENFECPACGCHDRERHLLLYLRASGLITQMRSARILHFAPETQLQRQIAKAQPAEYVLGDLHPMRSDVRRLDLLAIDFPRDSFDFVIANHVLEHVSDDVQALREIRRVLRPGGFAILQTPYASHLQSKFEDADITSEPARLQAYGQEDHCRLYGADFPAFVASLGFVAKTATHATLLRDVDAARMGVNALEPFLLFGKPEGQ